MVQEIHAQLSDAPETTDNPSDAGSVDEVEEIMTVFC